MVSTWSLNLIPRAYHYALPPFTMYCIWTALYITWQEDAFLGLELLCREMENISPSQPILARSKKFQIDNLIGVLIYGSTLILWGQILIRIPDHNMEGVGGDRLVSLYSCISNKVYLRRYPFQPHGTYQAKVTKVAAKSNLRDLTSPVQF